MRSGATRAADRLRAAGGERGAAQRRAGGRRLQALTGGVSRAKINSSVVSLLVHDIYMYVRTFPEPCQSKCAIVCAVDPARAI